MARPVDPELRARLLAAATDVFAERGFAGATMAEIGRRAGVTKGGVYFHFRGKEELFFAVFDARRERLRRILEERPEPSASGADALRGLVGAYLARHFDDPAGARLLRVLLSELQDRFTAALREDAAAEQRLLRARIRELLAAGNHDGSLFAPDPALTAFVLAGAVRGVLDQWLTSPADAEPFCRPPDLAAELVSRFATGAAPRARAESDAGADFHPPVRGPDAHE